MNTPTPPDQKLKDIIFGYLTCVCDEAYKSRNMSDPNCAYCYEYETIVKIAQDYHASKMKERAGVEKIKNALKDFYTDQLHRCKNDEEREINVNHHLDIILSALRPLPLSPPTDSEIEKIFPKGTDENPDWDNVKRQEGAKMMRDKWSSSLTGQQEGWISVEDRLPEKQQQVIVYFKNSAGWHVTTAYWNEVSFNELCEYCGHNESYPPTVTHWQPLPPAPTNQ